MANMRINPDGTPMAIDPMLWDQGYTQHPNNNDQFSYTSNQNNYVGGQNSNADNQFSCTSNQNNHIEGQCSNAHNHYFYDYDYQIYNQTPQLPEHEAPNDQPISGYALTPLPIAVPFAALPIDYGTSAALQCLRATYRPAMTTA